MDATKRLAAVCMMALLLSPRFASAQGLPDVFHVADKTGAIEFQDEVKAVSYSRSTDGYYLSFGAPYPAQVLSVWVPARVHRQLPRRGELVGRTVRVKGDLQKGPDGPLLKVDSPDQIVAMQVDEGVLGKAKLDGKMDRDQFQGAVWQLLTRNEFDTLETLAEELRQSRERFGDGTWLVDAYFKAFRLPPAIDQRRFDSLATRIAAWEEARPDSLIVQLVKAGFHRDLAWRARAAGGDAKTKAERRETFLRELAAARQILENYPGAKMHPEYFAILQKVALGEAWKREQYLQLFQEAVTREPDFYQFYFNAALYLSPCWYGKKGEWEEFALRQRDARAAGGAGDALYARIAWSMHGGCWKRMSDTTLSWPIMASGFDYLLKQHPESRYLRNADGFFAWVASDRERLRARLREIGDQPDMNIWVNLENYALAQRFAEANE